MATENCYYKRNSMSGKVILIKHGETGYYPTTNQDIDDDGIAAANAINGNTKNMVYAAETCSMFDIWYKFDEIVAKLDMIDETMH